jgi:imidazolonepropionase-like amidohydrolase
MPRAPLTPTVALLLAPALAAAGGGDVDAGAVGGAGLALRARKALTVAAEGPSVIDHAVALVRDGKLEAVGPASELAIPAGYRVEDLGASWIMPGMIDLHSHVGGSGDINDMVLQTNEGLRVSTAVVPQNPNLQRLLCAGVTTVLFIPGSGTNIGGQGILIKTGLATFEDMRLRDPGSLKIAQGDNPTRFAYGMGRALMTWHVRSAVSKGMAHARARAKGRPLESRSGSEGIQYEVFDELLAQRTQVSTHTQVYHLVLTSIQLLKGEFGLDVYIDHGEWGAFRLAELAQELGVAAICGPRIADTPANPRSDTDGAVLSVPGEYQKRGLELVGFNTDAPVVPAEELPVQAAMGVRYGMESAALQHVRGLTLVPAIVAGIDERVGSLEAGKDADIVVLGGDPADPRSGVERVYIDGRLVYRADELGAGGRRW